MPGVGSRRSARAAGRSQSANGAGWVVPVATDWTGAAAFTPGRTRADPAEIEEIGLNLSSGRHQQFARGPARLHRIRILIRDAANCALDADSNAIQ